DAAPADLLCHQLGLDHLLPGLLADVAVLPFTKLAARSDLVQNGLIHAHEILVADRLSVDLRDHAGRPRPRGWIQNPAELEDSKPDQEDDGGNPDDHLHVVPHGLHHGKQTSIEYVRNACGAPRAPREPSASIDENIALPPFPQGSLRPR